ncbi:MAG: hypothetical protein U0V54_10145 [Saprospiraceae bacterium]
MLPPTTAGFWFSIESAPESTGHGSPMPLLVHGGPGRAGGGEEMGGMRGESNTTCSVAPSRAALPPLPK